MAQGFRYCISTPNSWLHWQAPTGFLRPQSSYLGLRFPFINQRNKAVLMHFYKPLFTTVSAAKDHFFLLLPEETCLKNNLDTAAVFYLSFLNAYCIEHAGFLAFYSFPLKL